jgi:hypothetical protein
MQLSDHKEPSLIIQLVISIDILVNESHGNGGSLFYTYALFPASTRGLYVIAESSLH